MMYAGVVRYLKEPQPNTSFIFFLPDYLSFRRFKFETTLCVGFIERLFTIWKTQLYKQKVYNFIATEQ